MHTSSAQPSYTGATVQFSAERLAEVKQIIARYPEGKQKSAILPILHMAQADFDYLSPEVMDYVASLLDIQPVEVYEVATFYTMFHLKPVGKYVLEVCKTGPCGVLGAGDVIDKIKSHCGIEIGETSADGMFTLKPVECLAACGMGPVMQIREQYYEHLSEQNIVPLLEKLKNTDPKTVGYIGGMPINVKEVIGN